LKKDVIHKRLVASLLAGVITVSSIGGVSLLASTSYADDSNKETTGDDLSSYDTDYYECSNCHNHSYSDVEEIADWEED